MYEKIAFIFPLKLQSEYVNAWLVTGPDYTHVVTTVKDRWEAVTILFAAGCGEVVMMEGKEGWTLSEALDANKGMRNRIKPFWEFDPSSN